MSLCLGTLDNSNCQLLKLRMLLLKQIMSTQLVINNVDGTIVIEISGIPSEMSIFKVRRWKLGFTPLHVDVRSVVTLVILSWSWISLHLES